MLFFRSLEGLAVIIQSMQKMKNFTTFSDQISHSSICSWKRLPVFHRLKAAWTRIGFIPFRIRTGFSPAGNRENFIIFEWDFGSYLPNKANLMLRGVKHILGKKAPDPSNQMFHSGRSASNFFCVSNRIGMLLRVYIQLHQNNSSSCSARNSSH